MILSTVAFPVGKCRQCDAPVSPFAPRCSSCHAANLPNPVAIVTALVVVIALGFLVALGLKLWHGKQAGQVAQAPQTSSPAQSEPASSDPDDDYGWIVEAMAECQEEAKLKRDTLHFLIVPITPTGVSLPGWAPNPITTIGSSGVLLSSTDALIGLRNGALALYPKPLTFLVSDPANNALYKWRPAVGVARLKGRDTGQARLTLGFEIPDVAQDIEWGPTISLSKGACYWINPLLSTKPPSG